MARRRAIRTRRPSYYCYVDAAMTAVVRVTTAVPNINRAGRPRLVYLTTNRYTSAAKAEVALQIGRHHPRGPYPPPDDRLLLDVSACTLTYNGIVPGGTGTEYTTPDAPKVRTITPLGP